MELALPLYIINKKEDMKLRRSRNIENKDSELNFQYIERVMGMNMASGLQKQDCLMQKR